MTSSYVRAAAEELARIRQRGRWWSDAACRGLPLDLFFPEGSPSPAAITTCEACPVRVDCLADEVGVPDDEILGIRAGLTPEERRDLLKHAKEIRARLAVHDAVARGESRRTIADRHQISVRTTYRWAS